MKDDAVFRMNGPKQEDALLPLIYNTTLGRSKKRKRTETEWDFNSWSVVMLIYLAKK
jgi:hypothetical protein